LLEVPVGLATFLLFGRGPFVRLLIPKASSHEAVERRAFELFSARGLHGTRDRTGMLILVSELEHRVVILGDRAIHERVGNAGWQTHVDHIVAAIRRGEAVTGILEVIERLDRAHAELLPAAAGDTNELPDDIVRD
jgi:putative membrane protein